MQLPEQLARVSVGRERISDDELAAHQRRRIVRAAVGVFAKRGYQQTTIDNIVAAAKASVGGFYTHFDSKEDCFLQSYEMVVSEATSEIEAGQQATGSWPERASALLGALLARVEAEPLAARLVLVEAQTAGPRALSRYEATLDLLADGLRHGRSLLRGAPEPPVRLEEAAVAGAAWLLHERLALGEAKGCTELLPELATLLLGPYVGDQAARRLADATALQP